MSFPLLGAAVLCAGLDWFAVWRDRRILGYVFKPATMLVLFAWFAVATGLRGPALWFGIGLILSMAGDISMMFSSRLLLAGIGAFLAAHLTYIIGFNPSLPPITSYSVVLVAMVGLTAYALYRQIAAGLAQKPEAAALRPSVLVYTVVLSLMLASAVLTLNRPEWSRASAGFAVAGGLLFFISDSLLAMDRFVSPIRHGKLIVHATYHLGQVGLMLGMAMHGIQ